MKTRSIFFCNAMINAIKTICLLIITSPFIYGLPLSLLSEDKLKELSDAILEARGYHRVKPGETTYALAKQAGMSIQSFYKLNYENSGFVTSHSPEQLMAGGIVQIRNPLEISSLVKGLGKEVNQFSLHEYEFSGQAECHCDYKSFSCGHISCCWSIAWPEENCGLSSIGIEKLRFVILSHCFGMDENMGKWIPPKTIEEAENYFKQLAWQRFRGKEEVEPDSICDMWKFNAFGELHWPFGMRGNLDKWYGRPVICFKNNGYSWYGGNGTHSYVTGCIVSIPDGKILTEHDYFREDALKELAELVARRMVKKHNLQNVDPSIQVRSGDDCWLTISEEGMTWYLRPYSLFCGAAGAADVTIPWEELEAFKKESDIIR